MYIRIYKHKRRKYILGYLNLIKNNTYKLFSIFLSYPNVEIKKYINKFENIIKNENIIKKKSHFNLLKKFISFIKKNEIIYLQEYYVETFDKNKELSLYLFEHIHGDSRDRGMAMIDLIELYKKKKFTINEKYELPDYIPLFLEYLSVINKEKSKKLLKEITNIISTINKKLKTQNNKYYYIFNILEEISSKKNKNKLINEKFKNFNSATSTIDNDWEEPKAF